MTQHYLVNVHNEVEKEKGKHLHIKRRIGILKKIIGHSPKKVIKIRHCLFIPMNKVVIIQTEAFNVYTNSTHVLRYLLILWQYNFNFTESKLRTVYIYLF